MNSFKSSNTDVIEEIKWEKSPAKFTDDIL